jgi:dTMP kinase
VFVAVEGPNGVGKTTIATLLGRRWRELGSADVHLTKEPTATPLGRLVRSQEALLRGRALALAVAADRTAHVDNEIAPLLSRGVNVVTDRYVPSSLVLQRIDGLDLDEIWTYNRHLPRAVTIYLEHDPAVIRARLAARSQRSRLELAGTAEQELQLYHETADYLDRRGWTQHALDCRDRTAEQVVATILAVLWSTTG